jgi:predicted TIM-barrel fold metal-dependent hydrolase
VIIDCDVHPIVPGGMAALYDFMPPAWGKRFELKGASMQLSDKILRFAHPTNGSAVRRDAAPPGGGAGGSDPAFVISDYIEREGVERALLNSLQASALAAALAGPDESIVIARAFNDFFIARWLELDPRFRLAAVVPTQDPAAAAEEIARVAEAPGVAAIFLPLVASLMGNRHYFPIYEAASRHGLPIYVHLSGAEQTYQGAPTMMGGVSESYIERFANSPLIGQANLISLVVNGVFERFPSLKVIFAEFGFTWLPPVLWRLDRAWEGLRVEVPWLTRRPSEVVREHVRFTTQPLDEPDDPAQLDQLIAMLGTEVLLFSSDYPHWDNDMPTRVLRGLDSDQRRDVLGGNARRTLRLT